MNGKKRLVSVLMEPEDFERLDEISAKTNRRRSQTVRQFVRSGLDEGVDKPLLVALLAQAVDQANSLEGKIPAKEVEKLRKTLGSIVKTLK